MGAKTKQTVMDIQMTNYELLTIQEVAVRLWVNKNMVYDLIKKNYLKSFKLGTVRYRYGHYQSLLIGVNWIKLKTDRAEPV